MLFDPERHTQITTEKWNSQKVLEGIHQIFDFLCAGREENGLWPAHPDEESDIPFNKSLYNGATGTVWGLLQLSQFLKRDLPFDPQLAAKNIYDSYLAEPDTGSVVPSVLLGETGVLLLLNKLSPSSEITEKLRKAISANTRNPANEALWGSPGTMLAALRIGATDLYTTSADYLFEQWTNPEGDMWIWHQDLYGMNFKFIGAGHGFFGNVHALLEGYQLLKPSQQQQLLERTVETALASAQRENGMANWMPGFYMKDPRPPLTQWCHGAPGIVTSLRSFPKNHSPELEKLLLEAGETVWASGPMKKGVGICHGTDGNGFALLRLFERTGNEMWLDRARSFAMHALSQRNGRYTLWTGEVGLALYLIACIQNAADFPSLDYF
ncbi:lanthionine synthetase C family protein [Bdellovibrio sp. GT3]|uniref:lanthionine synthetase C family protein n=1 Tax=Bdellovibrio sp. GT3 TaxID=3136282 RepID=UPI0030EFB3B1